MPNVAVLMPVYNGACYLAPQLESIFFQKDVDVHLYARDDRSSDESLEVLRKFQELHPESMTVYECGEEGNLGAFGSFDYLLENTPREYEYYALATQDDVWLPDKLSAAVSHLENTDQPMIYTGSLTAVDCELNTLCERTFADRHNTLPSLFVRFSQPGVTFVVNKALIKLTDRFGSIQDPERFSIEPRLLLTCICCGGEWIRDEKSYVLYRRQTGQNYTVNGSGFSKRIKWEMKAFCRTNIFVPWAEDLLDTFPDGLTDETREFLELVRKQPDSLSQRIALVRYPGFTSGRLIFDVVAKLRILLPRW